MSDRIQTLTATGENATVTWQQAAETSTIVAWRRHGVPSTTPWTAVWLASTIRSYTAAGLSTGVEYDVRVTIDGGDTTALITPQGAPTNITPPVLTVEENT